MAYEIHVTRPVLLWRVTSKKKALSEQQAVQILSEHLGTKIKPADLNLFLFKPLIIGGRKTITLHKR